MESQLAHEHISRDYLKKFDKEHSFVQLQCEFFNQIPLNVFEIVSVCFQRRTNQESHDVGDRQAWHDGLEVSFGCVRCIVFCSKKNSTIDVCLYGKVADMPQVWIVIESLSQDLKSILKPYNGIIRSIQFVCRHCVMFCISEPYLWHPKHVFPKKGKDLPETVKCPKDPSNEVPAALVIHVFKGIKMCSVHELSLL